MKQFIKKPIVIVIFIIVLAVIMYGIFGGSGADPVRDSVIVKKGDVVQEVSVTGVVKPSKSVDLGFEKSGTVSAVYAKVGDKVVGGQTLAVLENGEINAQKSQASADLKSAMAKLAGSMVAFTDAQRNYRDKTAEAHTKADEAVRNNVDGFFNDPRTGSPKLKFRVNSEQLKIDVEWNRYVIETLLTKWDAGQIDANVSAVKAFLDKAWLALNGALVDASVSLADIAGWKTDLTTAQTSMNTVTSNLTAAGEKLRAAESEVDVNKALVEKARASIDYYSSLLAKSYLRSPIAGVITAQDAKVGQIALTNTTLISMISAGQYEIEANIPEADIAKVKIADTARVSLDAYGSDTFFDATVASIDPAETMIDGVATYKVKFRFAKQDERIRSGMTANIDISTASRANVLIVPSRAIATKSGRKVVQLVSGETTSEVEVKTGLRGSDGNVEILEGLTEGQEVQITVQ